jgi:hypothetical protein
MYGCSQVEGQLFRIHRYFLMRESEEFRRILTSNKAALNKDDDDAPVILHDVTCGDFESFLGFFYEG